MQVLPEEGTQEGGVQKDEGRSPCGQMRQANRRQLGRDDRDHATCLANEPCTGCGWFHGEYHPEADRPCALPESRWQPVVSADRKLIHQHAKPQSSPSSKDLGRSDPEALDGLAEAEAKMHQQDAGINIHVSSGRFDTQFCVKRLSEMMSKPRKMGNLRLARLSRYPVARSGLRSDLIISSAASS